MQSLSHRSLESQSNRDLHKLLPRQPYTPSELTGGQRHHPADCLAPQRLTSLQPVRISHTPQRVTLGSSRAVETRSGLHLLLLVQVLHSLAVSSRPTQQAELIRLCESKPIRQLGL
jgi:hypothetical protein